MTDIAPEIPEAPAEEPVEEEKPKQGKVIASYLTRIVVREATPGAEPPKLDELDDKLRLTVELLGYETGEQTITATVESERLDK